MGHEAGQTWWECTPCQLALDECSECSECSERCERGTVRPANTKKHLLQSEQGFQPYRDTSSLSKTLSKAIMYQSDHKCNLDMELWPHGTAIINQTIEKHPLVDPGVTIYHPLPKISEFRKLFERYSYLAYVYRRTGRIRCSARR